jgi:hypothetical protein
LPDGTIAGFPAWITEAAKNSAIEVGAPLTSAAALVKLRTLLDTLHANARHDGASSLKDVRRKVANDIEKDAGDDSDEPAVS